MSRLPSLIASVLTLSTPMSSLAEEAKAPNEKMSASRQRYDARNDILRQMNESRKELSRTLSEDIKRGKITPQEAQAQLDALRQLIEGVEEEQIEDAKQFQAEAASEKEDPPADPSDLYFQGWLLSREAEKSKAGGELERSRENLKKALELFSYVAKEHPKWKPEMVQGRLKKTKDDLTSLPPETR